MKKLILFLLLLSLSLVSACDNGSSGVPNDAVHYFSFDGNSTDLGSDPKNGTATDLTWTADRSGTADSACSFNGTSSEIAFADGSGNYFAPPTVYSVSVWIKTSDSYGNILNWTQLPSNPGTDNAGLYASEDIISYAVSDGLTAGSVDGTTSVTDDTWTHVVLIRDTAAQSIYINSVLDSPVSDISKTITLTDFFIGKNFAGAIDDLHIYDRILSGKEIRNLFNE